MGKNIPVYFDTIILNSPAQDIALQDNTNGSRLKVAVFTKYKNRNGSYISDAYAEKLIASATRGDTPVVGFFDPQEQIWASHTGPTLANGYGYVEDFIGWEPLTDTDGVEREYAVFSIVIFSKYWEEAKKIYGQNQSMELDINTIQGDWADFDGEEYFVYTSGDMLGLCVIGSHEPCFSVSHFFSKNDDTYKDQYEKFSSLLSNLRAQVEETQNNVKGGEQPMAEFENQEVVVTPEPEVVETPEAEQPVVTEFEETEVVEEQVIEPVVEEPSVESEPEQEPEGPSEYELLQAQYNELTAQFEQAQATISELQTANADLTANLEQVTARNQELETALAGFAAQAQANEVAHKNELIEKYSKIISNSEEFDAIKAQINDFSYEALESKLAIIFATQQMASSEESIKVPLPEPQESQFALLMKKYRKN